MFQLTHEIHVGARTRTVWQVWSDVARWHEWTASIAGIEPLQPGPFGKGARYRVRQPGLPDAVWEVSECAEPNEFVWVSTAPGVRVEGRHRIVPVRVGCTCRMDLRYEGPLGGLIGRLLRAKAVHYLELEASGLKQRCEELEWTSAVPGRGSSA